MQDILNEDDVKKLIEAFYAKAIQDEVIDHFFEDVLGDNWPEHIEKIEGFWVSILLGKQSYSGNPMTVHYDLNKKYPMTHLHFDRWLMLWESTVNELFEGPVASDAVNRAKNISGLMAHKIVSSNRI